MSAAATLTPVHQDATTNASAQSRTALVSIAAATRMKRWFERRDEELGTELEEMGEGSLRIASIYDAIVRADGLLREAFAIGEGRQRGLVAHALLRCCDAWAATGAPRGEDEIVE